MPERILYDEAMMLASACLKVADPELKGGEVEVIRLATTQGTIERPWGIEGGFAVVYKFRKRSGKYCALRCFWVPMPKDIQSRYERINSYFSTHIPQITVGFKYHEQGILVEEAALGTRQSRIYPIVEMDWVEGETLIETVNKLCMKRERAGLFKLVDQWLVLFTTLQQNHIAHGDLSGVDIMVKADGQLVLVDYDGVYIPGFSGLPPLILGKEDYQHPEMGQRKFNEQMDDFSALVIYTALLALALQPELWDEYAFRNPQGKPSDANLLFRREDFDAPSHSTLVRKLQGIDDLRLQHAVKELKKACLQPIDQVRFPFSITDSHQVDALGEVINSDRKASKSVDQPYLPRPGVDERVIVEEMIRDQNSKNWEACYNFVERRVNAKAKNAPASLRKDMVQEIMHNVTSYLPHFRFQCALKTWLRAIIEHQIIDEYRKLRNEGLHLPLSLDQAGETDPEGLESNMSEVVSTEDALEMDEQIRIGIAALQEYANAHSNPTRNLHIIRMVLFEGKTYEEAAIAVGCSIPVVGYVVREAQHYVHDKSRGLGWGY